MEVNPELPPRQPASAVLRGSADAGNEPLGSRGDAALDTVVEDADRKPIKDSTHAAGEGMPERRVGPAEVGIGSLAVLNLLGTAYREFRAREIVFYSPKRTVRTVDRLDKSLGVLRVGIGVFAALWILGWLRRKPWKQGKREHSTDGARSRKVQENKQLTTGSKGRSTYGRVTDKEEEAAPHNADQGVLNVSDPEGPLPLQDVPLEEKEEWGSNRNRLRSIPTGTFTRQKEEQKERGGRAWLGAAMAAAFLASLGTVARLSRERLAPVRFRGVTMRVDGDYISGRRVSTPGQVFEKSLWAVSASVGAVAALKLLLSRIRRQRSRTGEK